MATTQNKIPIQACEHIAAWNSQTVNFLYNDFFIKTKNCNIPTEIIQQFNNLPVKSFCLFSHKDKLSLFRVTKPYSDFNKYNPSHYFAPSPNSEPCKKPDRFRVAGKSLFYGTKLSNLAFHESYQFEINSNPNFSSKGFLSLWEFDINSGDNFHAFIPKDRSFGNDEIYNLLYSNDNNILEVTIEATNNLAKIVLDKNNKEISSALGNEFIYNQGATGIMYSSTLAKNGINFAINPIKMEPRSKLIATFEFQISKGHLRISKAGKLLNSQNHIQWFNTTQREYRKLISKYIQNENLDFISPQS